MPLIKLDDNWDIWRDDELLFDTPVRWIQLVKGLTTGPVGTLHGRHHRHGFAIRAAHVTSLGRREAPYALELPMCPKCATQLRLVPGRYGAFLGCTRFRQCGASPISAAEHLLFA